MFLVSLGNLRLHIVFTIITFAHETGSQEKEDIGGLSGALKFSVKCNLETIICLASATRHLVSDTRTIVDLEVMTESIFA